MMTSTDSSVPSVPQFWESEIKWGRILGKGTYCVVMVVQDIRLSEDAPPFPLPPQDHHATTSNSDIVRQRLAQKYSISRNKKRDLKAAIYGKINQMDDPCSAPKLALKRIRNDSTDPQTAQADFRREMNILKTISHNHPNIVDLVGIGYNNKTKEPTSLLLSQMKTTLDKRLCRWRDEKGIGVFEALKWGIAEQKNLWVERLVVLSRLAHAVQHMHSHNIIYRDIKPENVGFDAVSDIPKLLDFGLARVIESDHEEGLLFQLTPDTGTLRYMAMEVGLKKPYGWTADTYSMGILMHEVLSLKVPFGGIRPSQFRELVWTQRKGLPLDPTWPSTILELLPKMGQSNPSERPSMEEVVEALDQMLRGSDEGLFPESLVPDPTARPFFDFEFSSIKIPQI